MLHNYASNLWHEKLILEKLTFLTSNRHTYVRNVGFPVRTYLKFSGKLEGLVWISLNLLNLQKKFFISLTTSSRSITKSIRSYMTWVKAGKNILTKGSFMQYEPKFFWKAKISYPLIRKCLYVYPGVRNVSFRNILRTYEMDEP